MYSDFTISDGGARVIRTLKNNAGAVAAGGLGAFSIILLICLICFCCSVSSSFGAMYYKRASLCANSCQSTDVTLEEVAESFKNTTPCVYKNKNDIIYNYDAYRSRDQGY